MATSPGGWRSGGYDAAVATENIGAGYHNLNEAFAGWRASSHHRANMLKKDVTKIGIAVAYNKSSKFKDFWSLVLARPDERPARWRPHRRTAGRRNDAIGMMLERPSSYQILYEQFRWAIPNRFNIAVACSEKWTRVDASRTALVRLDARGTSTPVSFGDAEPRIEPPRPRAPRPRRRPRRPGRDPAAAIGRDGDRPPRHLQARRDRGAARGPLRHRRAPLPARTPRAPRRSSPTMRGWPSSPRSGPTCPSSRRSSRSTGRPARAEGYREALASHAETFVPEATGPDDPALMIFTSGTTGPPKGALHGHRVLLGHLPGFAFTHAPYPEAGDRMWTPSDWAWAGGLLNALLPEPLSRRAGGLRPLPPLRPGGGLRADGGGRGAERLPAADGDQDDARGRATRASATS